MEGSTISIRFATRADADSILECLRVAFEPFRNRYPADGFAYTTLTSDALQRRFATMMILVATNATGEIVGTVGGRVVSPEEGHIRGMAVRPDWQGQGVAERLLGAVESELRAKRCLRVSLDTTEPLQRAIRFYEHHGYRPSGKISDFFGMPLFEFVKTLAPGETHDRKDQLSHDPR